MSSGSWRSTYPTSTQYSIDIYRSSLECMISRGYPVDIYETIVFFWIFPVIFWWTCDVTGAYSWNKCKWTGQKSGLVWYAVKVRSNIWSIQNKWCLFLFWALCTPPARNPISIPPRREKSVLSDDRVTRDVSSPDSRRIWMSNNRKALHFRRANAATTIVADDAQSHTFLMKLISIDGWWSAVHFPFGST